MDNLGDICRKHAEKSGAVAERYWLKQGELAALLYIGQGGKDNGVLKEFGVDVESFPMGLKGLHLYVTRRYSKDGFWLKLNKIGCDAFGMIRDEVVDATGVNKWPRPITDYMQPG